MWLDVDCKKKIKGNYAMPFHKVWAYFKRGVYGSDWWYQVIVNSFHPVSLIVSEEKQTS